MVEIPGMSFDRYERLMNDIDLELTDEEIDVGWHFCRDWDGLLIHKTHPEAKSCYCQFIPL